MAKFKLFTLRLHWGEPKGQVRWLVTDRGVKYTPKQEPCERDLTVMTGLSFRFGPGFAFLGFQYIKDVQP